LAEAENTTKNLSTALAGMSIKTEKTIKRASILAKQLKEISLSLIMARKKKAAMIPKIEYTICRLMTPKIHNKRTQIMEVTC
jgi:peroxiredoxin